MAITADTETLRIPAGTLKNKTFYKFTVTVTHLGF
jgi:hypothetical protein